MTKLFRLGDYHANSNPNIDKYVPPAERTADETNSGMSSLTNKQMLIRLLKLENERLCNRNTYYISVEEMKPDKVKDATILNDFTFYIGSVVFRLYNSYLIRKELYNHEKKGTLGHVVIS